MPTLLQINSIANTGSTGKIVEELGRMVIAEGWTSYVAFGREAERSESNLIKIGTKFNVIFHVIQSRLLDNHGFGSYTPTRTLIRKIDRIRPDIIHLHNLHGYYLNVRSLFHYLSGLNVPVVWTLHDCWAFTGHCAHFDFVGCNLWKSECTNCPQLRKYPATLFADRSIRNYQEKKRLFNSLRDLTLVAVSNWLANTLKWSFLSRHPIKVINNGIDLSVFAPAASGKELSNRYNVVSKFVILGVANTWGESKGFADFVRLSKMIDSDCIIVLVGLDKNLLTDLPHNIIGITRLENPRELAELYSRADVFVNPSVEETFGLTTVESMACGTPVVVYNTTASPETVTPETGFVVPSKDVASLWESIKIIRGKGKSYYSEHCITTARTKYDRRERFYDYMCLFRNLLKTNCSM